MILDTSAIIAILFQEPGYESLLNRLSDAQGVAIGAPTLVECGIVLSARLGEDARGLLARFLEEAGVVTVALTHVHFGVAVRAWLQYGKGRHAAALNLGDCLSYAVAKLADRPLLYSDHDFPQTDLPSA